jgi:ectoine hydroxylase-related dioxygenase (phytanoyl-CoA dioxygenase family)
MGHVAAAWDTDGVVVVPSALDDAGVAAADDHLAGRVGLVAGNVGVDPAWLALARAPGLVAAAASVLGPGVQIFSACYVVKAPRSDAHARWHQDGGSWPISPLDAATVWVALDDADERRGAMSVIPGSHRAGLLPHTADDASIFGVGTDAPAGLPRVLELRPGDASVHHPLLVHSSGPNTSSRRRAALVIRYVAAGVRIIADGWPPLLPAQP